MSGPRRAVGVLPALVLALALLVAACSGAPPPVVGQVPVPAPAPTPQLEPDPTELRIGVDDLGIGFNPHRVADDTPIARALAPLVLPSAFRPGPDGEPRLDTTVVTSARVTDTEPYTVSYEIAAAATWSDNAPVAAEDFVYLWQQMRSQPGVVGAAGYRAISDVRSRAGGKAVDVVFDRPFPAWPTLFDHLLPAHLLKDAPGSWGGGLTDSIPVSAGPFTVRVVDRVRGQVTLARNDRYWGTPSVPDEIVFQAAEATSLIDRVRSGDVQAMQFRATGDDLAALATAGPGLTVRALPEPAVVQLALRSDDGPLADLRVRQAVASAIDRSALREVGADGGPSEDLPADAFARAPSQAGYRSTLPAGSPAAQRDLGESARLLTEAGYTRGEDGQWSRAGQPLVLRLAAPPQVAPFGRLVSTLGTQLRAAGIASVVVADGGATPFQPGRGPASTTTAAVPTPAPTPTTAGPPRQTPAQTPGPGPDGRAGRRHQLHHHDRAADPRLAVGPRGRRHRRRRAPGGHGPDHRPRVGDRLPGRTGAGDLGPHRHRPGRRPRRERRRAEPAGRDRRRPEHARRADEHVRAHERRAAGVGDGRGADLHGRPGRADGERGGRSGRDRGALRAAGLGGAHAHRLLRPGAAVAARRRVVRRRLPGHRARARRADAVDGPAGDPALPGRLGARGPDRAHRRRDRAAAGEPLRRGRPLDAAAGDPAWGRRHQLTGRVMAT